MSDSFATPWTVACQAPLFMGFPRQEYWGGLPFPPPGDLPNPGIKITSPALAGRFFTTESLQFSSVAQLCLTLCDPMDCSTTRLCPSPTPGIYSNSCPSSQWCHPTISSSVVPFPFCLQSFLASGSFQMSQFFTSGGQILELQLQLQHQSFQ